MNSNYTKLAACLSLVFALLLPAGCVKEDDMVEVGRKISLKASLVPSDILTRGEGVLDPHYGRNLVIGMARIDESVTEGYPMFDHTEGQLEAVMKPGKTDLNSRDISFVDSFQQFMDERHNIKFASWYPYGKGSYDHSKKTVTTPIDGTTDIMYGSVATGNQRDGFNTIFFEHALSKFTFHVYAMVQHGGGEETVGQVWGKVKSIKIMGLATGCEITLPVSGGKVDTYKIAYNGVKPDNAMSIPSDRTDGVLVDKLPVGVNNALRLSPVLAAPPADGLLRVVVVTENKGAQHQSTSKTMTIAKDFKAGRNYDIFLRFSDHGIINPEISVGEWTEYPDDIESDFNSDIYYDLGTEETANSYIVTSANYKYCFDVTVKGNGSTGIVDGRAHQLNTGYIDVVWMDKGMDKYFHLENNYPINNRVLFDVTNDTSNADPTDRTDKVLSVKGNVLIGGYDRNPADGGKLLWTWHVWMIRNPTEQTYKNGYVVLDRDMGACHREVRNEDITDIDGLYYQWGRPTPLPLGREVVSPQLDPKGKIVYTKPFEVRDNAEAAGLDTRIMHPEYFYTDEQSIKQEREFIHLWGMDEKTLDFKKTIYDPCPPGYRLPSDNLFKYVDNMEVTLNGVHNHAYETIVDNYYKMTNPLSGYYEGSANPEIGRKGYFPVRRQAPDPYTGAYMWSGVINIDKDNSARNPVPYAIGMFGNKENGAYEETRSEERKPTAALPVRCVSVLSRPEVIDLSMFQTANCYIISQAGFYKFNPTVRGNGVGKLLTPGSGSSIDITEKMHTDIGQEVYKVIPLWWQGDLSTPDGNDIDKNPMPVKFLEGGKLQANKRVYFEVEEFRKGNLIVAGVDRKGAILWSWHLWLTDKPRNHDSHDYAVMDRFLGATVAPTYPAASLTSGEFYASLGLYYQWSRKDPFPGPTTSTGAMKWWLYDGSTATGPWIQMTELAGKTNMETEKTVAASVSSPILYHLSTDNVAGDNWRGYLPYDWDYKVGDRVSSPRNQCYSNLLNPSNMWGYSAAEGFGKTSSKTMYDPCPPGYSVAYYLVWTNSSIDNPDPVYTYKDAGNVRNPGVVALPGYGIFLTRGTFDKTWYPYTGYIDSYSGKFKKVGVEGRFHSSTPAGGGGRSLQYYGSGQTIYTGQAVDGKSYKGIPSAFALPVRCQKD